MQQEWGIKEREGGWETFNKSNAIKYKGMWLYIKKSWDILIIEWMKIKTQIYAEKLIGLEDDEELEIVKWSSWHSPNKRWERYCKQSVYQYGRNNCKCGKG